MDGLRKETLIGARRKVLDAHRAKSTGAGVGVRVGVCVCVSVGVNADFTQLERIATCQKIST